VTTLAPLRSQWTKAESVYHVRVTGILSHLLVKIQGWRPSGASPGWARDLARAGALVPSHRPTCDAPQDTMTAPQEAPPPSRRCRVRLARAAGASPARRAPPRPPPDGSPCLRQPWVLPSWAPRCDAPATTPRSQAAGSRQARDEPPPRWRHGDTTQAQGSAVGRHGHTQTVGHG
jgi:hypothetical protein